MESVQEITTNDGGGVPRLGLRQKNCQLKKCGRPHSQATGQLWNWTATAQSGPLAGPSSEHEMNQKNKQKKQ